MGIEPRYIPAALAIGIGASAIMDLWNLFLRRAFGIASLNYCMLGRWICHMPETFRHPSIARAERMPFECAVGWTAHYAIGIAFAYALIAITSGNWLLRPTLITALAFGIVTVVFPLFVLQPALGLGIASSQTPHPMKARLKSLATHAVFGIGLYACTVGVNLWLDF